MREEESRFKQGILQRGLSVSKGIETLPTIDIVICNKVVTLIYDSILWENSTWSILCYKVLDLVLLCSRVPVISCSRFDRIGYTIHHLVSEPKIGNWHDNSRLCTTRPTEIRVLLSARGVAMMPFVAGLGAISIVNTRLSAQ